MNRDGFACRFHRLKPILAGWLALTPCLPAADYELAGQIIPQARASVSLHGAEAPFESAMLTDDRGRFRFRNLARGAYTVVVFEPGRGEARETVEVGPSVADSAG